MTLNDGGRLRITCLVVLPLYGIDPVIKYDDFLTRPLSHLSPVNGREALTSLSRLRERDRGRGVSGNERFNIFNRRINNSV
jgi:hypothetical protein